MTSKILCGDAGSAFLKVFTPLAQSNATIEKSKNTCQHDPYVSLRTYCELKLGEIQVSAVIVDNYGTFGSTFNGGMTKTRDFIASSLGFTGRVWNSSPYATAQMLKTATDALKSSINDVNGSLPTNSDEVVNLLLEVNQIRATLKECRATVCHVFKTMLDPTSKQYEKGIPLNGVAIKTQYDELNATLNQLKLLKVDITSKLTAQEPVVEIKIEEPTTISRVKNLEFKSEVDASSWFKRQMNLYRKKLQEHNWTGDKCYKDLIALARNTDLSVPQSFYNFAKSLDASIKDPMLSCEFFQEFYDRCLYQKLLSQADEPITNFQELLCQLYRNKSERAVYQNIFKALLNEAGNGPLGLKHEAKIINEIIRSDYFAMFDPEHDIM